MNSYFRFLSSDFRFLICCCYSFLLISCNQSGSTETVKFNNYFRQGEQLYLKHCSNCHQANGTGLGRVYPPLNKSDFMENNFTQVICLMKNGIKGELLVNGENYNLPMPGISTLTDLEIAEIATYIYNSWSNSRGLIEVKEVSSTLKECK